MLKLFGREIDPGAPYLIYFSGERRELSAASLEHYKNILDLVYRAPSFAVASQLLASIPLDEIPNVILLTGLLAVDFIQDRRLIPLFESDAVDGTGFAPAGFGLSDARARRITVMTPAARSKLMQYRDRMRDDSGRGSIYSYRR